MASHNVAADEIAAHDKQLVAGAADEVLFARELGEVEILSDGTAAIYVCVDGSDAVVSGGQCYKLPASPAASSITIAASGEKVSLISAGTPIYSVTAV